jgi:hypothetical protein
MESELQSALFSQSTAGIRASGYYL